MDRDRLIQRGMRLCRAIARRHAGQGVDIEDLEGEGYLALVQAARDFDPVNHPGASFETFAWSRISTAVEHAIERASVFRLPIRLERLAARCRAAHAALQSEGILRPTWDEIGRRAGVDAEVVRECLTNTPAPMPIESFGLIDQEPRRDPEDFVAEVQLMMAQCTELQRRVIELVFFEGLTIGAVARLIHLRAQRVREAHDEACRLIAAEFRRRGWSSERWLVATAS